MPGEEGCLALKEEPTTGCQYLDRHVKWGTVFPSYLQQVTLAALRSTTGEANRGCVGLRSKKVSHYSVRLT